MDLYYPTRPFDAIFVPTNGRTARILQNGIIIIIITARPRVFDHVYGTGNNQSNTHGLTVNIWGNIFTYACFAGPAIDRAGGAESRPEAHNYLKVVGVGSLSFVAVGCRIPRDRKRFLLPPFLSS